VLATDEGKTRTIRINDPTPGLTSQVIADAVALIVQGDCFDGAKRGNIVKAVRLELFDVTRTTIEFD